MQYPNGNKLWTYPGELPISLIPNGAVPMGDYTMTVIANGTNGTPVHKRTASIRAVNPLPPVCDFTVSDSTSCESYSLNFQDLSSGPPTSWQWSFPGGNPETSDVKNPQGIVYSTAGVYDVELTVTNQVGNDTRTKTSFITISVVPPAPEASGAQSCFGEPAPSLIAHGDGLQWYYSNFLVSTDSVYIPSQTTPGTYQYTVTQTVNGCTSEPTTVSYIINALPDVTFSPLDSICGNVAPFTLAAGLPSGGIYTGPGITADTVFDPSLAGPGLHILTYTFTDQNGCVNSADQTVKVLPLASVSMEPVSAMCYGSSAIELSGSPEGGVFSGTGVTGTQFDPTLSGPGTYTLAYTIVDTTTGCNVWASQDVIVHPQPDPELADQSVCGNRTILIDAASQDYVTYLWQPGGESTSAIQVDTTGRGLGTFDFTVAITDVNGCAGTDTVSVNFYDCTGIDEPEKTLGIEIFPNPGDGLISLHSKVIPTGDYSLKIYNAANSLVYSENKISVKGEFSKNVDLRKYASGVYLLRVENSTNSWSKQFIIKR